MNKDIAFHYEDLCLPDCAIMHTILKGKKYFKHLKLTIANDTTISGPADMIKGFGRVNILLPNNTKLGIKYALYSPKFRRNLLNFKNIHANGYHIEIVYGDNIYSTSSFPYKGF